ncbi:hypothetical protein C440_07642 [Haloferax mucosum ATCC BAA-1512]|uniref:DUF952 domain-containing protein n=1 Tax=Haloferax mucosum ATCC BAA-1512 TaxID=662479 RepID=M0IDT4_9EURY|nr:DUF952 domain-containing protein [Haloferax mucosum]ELZ94931.1 hypothetical protein C440_07642 [Haloferax mucosum ATCC BAA-1512]
MAYIAHILAPADWETFEQTEEYRPASLDEQGFVHCSKLGQIVVVADVAHAHRDEWVLLLLDESRLEAPVRYETNEDGGSSFPHVYGPLTLDAVVDSFDFERDQTGFRLPEGLLNYESVR